MSFSAHFNTPEWKDFVSGMLTDTNSTDSKPLGGHRPIAPTSMDALAGSEPTLAAVHSGTDSGVDQFARFASHMMTGDLPGNLAGGDDDDDDFSFGRDFAGGDNGGDDDDNDDLAFSSFGQQPRVVHSFDDSDDDDEADAFGGEPIIQNNDDPWGAGLGSDPVEPGTVAHDFD